MIPTVDPRVKYVGSSYLRTLNLDGLRELTGAVVVQDGEAEPLVVLLPYQTYLAIQRAEGTAFTPPQMTFDNNAISGAVGAIQFQQPRELTVERDDEDVKPFDPDGELGR